MYTRGPVVQTNTGPLVLYAWNARENKLVDSNSVIPSLYRVMMMMMMTMKSRKKYIEYSGSN